MKYQGRSAGVQSVGFAILSHSCTGTGGLACTSCNFRQETLPESCLRILQCPTFTLHVSEEASA